MKSRKVQCDYFTFRLRKKGFSSYYNFHILIPDTVFTKSILLRNLKKINLVPVIRIKQATFEIRWELKKRKHPIVNGSLEARFG